MIRSKRVHGFHNKFKMLGRSRRYASDEEDDEELLFSSTQNAYTANDTKIEISNGKQRKVLRSLKIGTPEQVLHSEDAECFVVFPAGIFLRIASNPNPCDMLLSFNFPGLHGDNPKVVIPSMGAVRDVEVLRAPEESGPRSQKWCELFGIVSICICIFVFFCHVT